MEEPSLAFYNKVMEEPSLALCLDPPMRAVATSLLLQNNGIVLSLEGE